MKELRIRLNNVNDVKEFNYAATSINGDVDLISGRYDIDGKSIMGIYSLDISKVLICRVNAADEKAEEEAMKLLSKWAV